MMQLDANRIGTLNAIPLPVLIVTGDRVVFANQSCGTFLGVDPASLQNRLLWELCAPEHRSALRGAWNALERDGDTGTAIRVWFDGSEGRIPSVLRVNPVTFDGAPSWLVSLQEHGLPLAAVEDTPLTRREQQVLAMLAEGCTTSEMATRLKIAKQTVRLYVHSLVKKTGVRGRVELALLARRQVGYRGWCPPGCPGNPSCAPAPEQRAACEQSVVPAKKRASAR